MLPPTNSNVRSTVPASKKVEIATIDDSKTTMETNGHSNNGRNGHATNGEEMNGHSNNNNNNATTSHSTGTNRVKQGLAQMLKGGVIVSVLKERFRCDEECCSFGLHCCCFFSDEETLCFLCVCLPFVPFSLCVMLKREVLWR